MVDSHYHPIEITPYNLREPFHPISGLHILIHKQFHPKVDESTYNNLTSNPIEWIHLIELHMIINRGHIHVNTIEVYIPYKKMDKLLA